MGDAGSLWHAANVSTYAGPFRRNVIAFLDEHATPVALPIGLAYTKAWVLPLGGVGDGLRLHIYQETHTDDAAAAVCDQCRIIGWQHHPVCDMRYHFVVPAATGPLSAADAESLAGMVERSAAAAADAAAAAAITIPAALPGQAAAAAIHARDLASKQAAASESGGSAAAAGEPFAATCVTGDPAKGVPPQTQPLQIALPTEDALESPDRAGGAQFSAPPSIYDSRAHLLHGVLHLNGFGHLLRVNGLEGGSARVSGRRLMDLWDTLCTLLAARQVSVEDVSNKGGMELRVLFPAAFKATWYGRWGYAFGRAGFGIRPAAWKRAATATHEANLAACLRQAPPTVGTAPARIIARYQGRGVGCTGRAAGAPTGTLGGFLARMVHLLNHPEEAEPLLAGEPPDDQARAISASRRRSTALPADSGAAADAEGDAAQRSRAVDPAILSQPTPLRPQRPAAPAMSAAALAELRALQPAEELPRRQELLQPLQALVLPKRWGRDAMHMALEAALNALQGRRGRWLAAEAVRAAVRAALPGGADPALTEFALRSAAFRTWGGVAVYSEVDGSSGQRFFLLDTVRDPDHGTVTDQPSQPGADAADGSGAELAAGSPPLPPIPCLMVEPRRLGGSGGGSARPSSTRKPKLAGSKLTDPKQSAAVPCGSGASGSDAAAAVTAGGGQPAATATAEPVRQPELDAETSAHAGGGIAGPAEAAKLRASHRSRGSSRGTSPVGKPTPATSPKSDEKPAAHAQSTVSPGAAAQQADLQQATLQQAAAQQHQLAKLRSSGSPQVKAKPPAEAKASTIVSAAAPAQLKAGGPFAAVKGNAVKSEAVKSEAGTAVQAAEAAEAAGLAALGAGAVPVPQTPASPPPLPHRRLRSRPASAAALLTSAKPATAPPHVIGGGSMAPANGLPSVLETAPGRDGGGSHEPGAAVVKRLGMAKRKSSSTCGGHSNRSSKVSNQHSDMPTAAKPKPAAGKEKQPKGKRKQRKSSAALPAGNVAVPLPPPPKRMRAAAKAADAANHALFAGKRTSPKAAAVEAPADPNVGDPIAWGRRSSRSVRRGSLSGSPQRTALQGALVDGAASAVMDADMLPPGANGIPGVGAHATAAAATPGAAQAISAWSDRQQEAGSTGVAEPAIGSQQRHGARLPPKSVGKPPSHIGRPGSRQLPSVKAVAAGGMQTGDNAMTGVRKASAPEAAPAACKLAAPPPVITAGGAVGSRLRHEAALLAQDFSTAAAGPVENGRLRRGAPVDYSESRKRPAPEPVAPFVPKRPRSARVSEGGAAGVPLPTKKPWQLLVPGGPWPPLPQPTPQQNGPPTPQQTALPAPQQQQPALAAPPVQPAAVAPTVRDQVLCDLVCVFDTLVRSAIAPPGVPPRIRAAPADSPAAFAAAVQVLRDTKHFVKDYGGGSAVAAGGEVRLPVTLAMPAAPPAGEGARASGRRSIRARRVPPPPPELFAVAAGAQAAGVTAAAQAAFRETYRMFQDLEVDRVEGVEAMTAGQTVADLVGAPPLVAYGSGWDTSGAWRHAGGPEDWLVACSCGTRDDDGERMAACDACAAWAHTRCAGVADNAPVPPLFLCAACHRAGGGGGDNTNAGGGAEGPVAAAAQLPPVLL